MSHRRQGRAVVLGASVAGLLAARVLADVFESVIVVDRDELPVAAVPRRCVPQGEHGHGLLARGYEALEELFADFAADTVALGGIPVDIQRDTLWISDGNQLRGAESGLRGLCLSRPAIEGYIRERVAALPGVEIRAGHEAVGLLSTPDGTRVTGARIQPLGGAVEELAADLVVDATGRGNRGPTWLAELGYEPAAEERVDAHMVYVTREFRRTPGASPYAALVQAPWPGQPFGVVAIAVEGDRWQVTLLGCGPGITLPAELDEFVAFTGRLPDPRVHEILANAEPIGEPHRMRLPVSVRRRYEDARRLPEGLVSTGDAVCAFNPAYGQGMTVAAAEALTLRDCLAKGVAGLPQRFYRKAAKLIDTPWEIAVGGDLRFEHVLGPRTRKTAFINAYIGKVHRAAVGDAVVGRAFLRVANLMAAPPSLFAPGIVARVLRGSRRPAAEVSRVAGRQAVGAATRPVR
ncbi:FAD-dependent oxidoreductase [Hamadaea tsunoensis]|uniref:FAD-dependent oxidoreductase n=1 Tax=Hamadaea tsunoensis TaxID=53368 RepID=UPI00040A0691|nr:FAD-dependent monooxygenase [Hamadaea tsunoensis]